MAPKLQSARRDRFVQEYLVDLNGTQAAIRAGYSPRSADVTASRLLGNARVAAAVQAAMDERARRVGMTADEVLRELKAIGQSRVTNYEIGGDAKQPVAVKEGAPADAMAAVSSVKRRVRRVLGREGEPGEEIEDVELRLWSKPEALKLAGQHLKLFAADQAPVVPIQIIVAGPPAPPKGKGK
jgi:phage terminase small subunit